MAPQNHNRWRGFQLHFGLSLGRAQCCEGVRRSFLCQRPCPSSAACGLVLGRLFKYIPGKVARQVSVDLKGHRTKCSAIQHRQMTAGLTTVCTGCSGNQREVEQLHSMCTQAVFGKGSETVSMHLAYHIRRCTGGICMQIPHLASLSFLILTPTLQCFSHTGSFS